MHPNVRPFIALKLFPRFMKRLVIFSGAGMSAESGLKTFRDSGGLWEQYNIEEVATPEAWAANPKLVLDFYNMRRRQVLEASPNNAHKALVRLEEKYDVQVITQNIDDLHERAGSSKVLHLHGEILKARPENNADELHTVQEGLDLGDVNDAGVQLRPHVVWFGEDVPEMMKAVEIIRRAHIVLIVGTSLNVYPAAGLIHYAPKLCSMYIVDPDDVRQPNFKNVRFIKRPASDGVPLIVDELMTLSDVAESKK